MIAKVIHLFPFWCSKYIPPLGSASDAWKKLIKYCPKWWFKLNGDYTHGTIRVTNITPINKSKTMNSLMVLNRTKDPQAFIGNRWRETNNATYGTPERLVVVLDARSKTWEEKVCIYRVPQHDAPFFEVGFPYNHGPLYMIVIYIYIFGVTIWGHLFKK